MLHVSKGLYVNYLFWCTEANLALLVSRWKVDTAIARRDIYTSHYKDIPAWYKDIPAIARHDVSVHRKIC